MNIPKEIKCPYCKGEGWYYEGDDSAQCELCFGEGTIIIKEYADSRNLSVEEAYYQLKAEASDEEE